MGIKSNLKSALRPLARKLAPIAMPAHARWSYSAAGEDRAILAWLETYYGRNSRNIRYCDIGANHPAELNNTFLFYLSGSNGVLVEPDPALCASLRSERTRDIVINAGAAFDDRRSAKLQRLSSNVFNTFLSDQADFVVRSSSNWQPEQAQSVVDEVEVSLVPTNDILSEHFSDGIDFISIDAEGVDFQILQSIDFSRFKPKLICIEASRGSSEFDNVLSPFGYKLVSQMPDNFIYRLV